MRRLWYGRNNLSGSACLPEWPYLVAVVVVVVVVAVVVVVLCLHRDVPVLLMTRWVHAQSVTLVIWQAVFRSRDRRTHRSARLARVQAHRLNNLGNALLWCLVVPFLVPVMSRPPLNARGEGSSV